MATNNRTANFIKKYSSQIEIACIVIPFTILFALLILKKDSVPSLVYNIVTGALFGIPYFFQKFLQYYEKQEKPYGTLHSSGSDIFKFGEDMDDFVAHHAMNMYGNLYFYNIPLKTFDPEDDKFEKIWVNSIGKNHDIKKIHLLLDESFREEWIRVVNAHPDYFSDRQNGQRFLVKFMDIRKSEILNNTQCPVELKNVMDELQRALPYTRLNFGVWSAQSQGGEAHRDLVTMTAEGHPWGKENILMYFLAITERKGLCGVIRDFVIAEYNHAAGPESYASRFLN